MPKNRTRPEGSGFLSLVVTAAGSNPVINTGKAGRTFPLQRQLQDANGGFIGTAGAALSFKPVTCGAWSDDATNAVTALVELIIS